MKFKNGVKLTSILLISMCFTQANLIKAEDKPKKEETKKTPPKLTKVEYKGRISRTIKKISVNKRLVNKASYVLKGKGGLRINLPTLKKRKKGEEATGVTSYDKYLGKKIILKGDAIITYKEYEEKKVVGGKIYHNNKKKKKIIHLKTVDSIKLDK